MNKPTLSICIPTYNRADLLKKNLESIVSQFDDSAVKNVVEIVISDNASSDNTMEIVKEFQKKFDNIKYFRNANNVGFDRNVYNLLCLASGSFCWTLNDDTILKSKSIIYVLNILKDNLEVGFFCVSQNSLPSINDEKKFNNGSEWLKELGLTGGRLSQCIFKKEYLPKDMEKYFDNLWIHFSIALEIIKDKPAFFVKNVFENPPKDRICRWAVGGQALITYIELKKIIENLLFFGYDKEVIDDVLNSMAKGLPRQVITAKIWGLKVTFNKIVLLIKQFYKYPFWLFMSLIFLLTPTFVFKGAKKIKILLQ